MYVVMIDWISDYQLFLFDFDGLLVNTEEKHYQAYIAACQKFGCFLDWDFPTYFRRAQANSEQVKKNIFALFEQQKIPLPSWDALYKEKKEALIEILHREQVALLPGVHEFLRILQKNKKMHAVVTHSGKPLVELIKKQHEVLHEIPFWICREDYENPKPSPECYEKALERFAKKDDAIIGFEDSSRGMNALMATRATAVLVNGIDETVRTSFVQRGVFVFSSFIEIMDTPHALRRAP